jgi:hypothetical protein
MKQNLTAVICMMAFYILCGMNLGCLKIPSDILKECTQKTDFLLARKLKQVKLNALSNYLIWFRVNTFYIFC